MALAESAPRKHVSAMTLGVHLSCQVRGWRFACDFSSLMGQRKAIVFFSLFSFLLLL